MQTIDSFKTALSQGGARANQFQVNLSFPTAVASGTAAIQGNFLCTAASLPASTIENISVPYRGKIVNFAGERVFEPWSVTIINENDFNIRSAFERWMDYINSNAAVQGALYPGGYVGGGYQVNMNVTQLDRNNNPLIDYIFHDAYPVNVSEIALNYGDGATIEEFTVQFAYNFWVNKNTNGTGQSGLLGVNGNVSTPIGNIPIPGIGF